MVSRIDVALRIYADTSAIKLQNIMRTEAKWTDRTAHARQRLTGTASKVSKGFRIALAHGVDYGVWLELAHEKRFAIIQPTILVNANDIMKGLEGLLGRLSK